MNAIYFLTEWAIRSSLLIGIAAMALWVLQVKDSSIRLAAWTAVLAGSLLIPAMTASLPVVSVRVIETIPAAPTADAIGHVVGHATLVASTRNIPQSNPFDWKTTAFILYAAIALTMLLRLSIGLLGSLRLLRRSQATERENIRESERIAAPVTLGILRPAIILPPDWREWQSAKLDAVLAHERSHIERRDPLVQAISAVHRSLLWFSPLTWFLHSRIVRTAEEASDDAAIGVTQDRASYAELLLDFVQRGVRIRSTDAIGVPMARYGRADQRIHRILDSTVLSRGVSKQAIATIVLLGVPLAYVVATAKAQNAPSPAPQAQTKPAQPAAIAPPQKLAPPAQPSAKTRPTDSQGYLRALGTVSANMVAVRSPIEGLLRKVDFSEGQSVEAGKSLAIVGPENRGDLANVKIAAPIAGVTGLRQIDAGNTVHPGEVIVTIAQLQPIAVVFSIPEDFLPQVRKRLSTGDGPAVEAWTRDEKTKIATGTLTATDNQIDEQSGTIKLKATFDNKDSALFPNQFVNVRLKTR